MNYSTGMAMLVIGILISVVIVIHHLTIRDCKVPKIKLLVCFDDETYENFIVKEWYVDDDHNLYMQDHDGHERVIAYGNWIRVDELEKSWYKAD